MNNLFEIAHIFLEVSGPKHKDLRILGVRLMSWHLRLSKSPFVYNIKSLWIPLGFTMGD